MELKQLFLERSAGAFSAVSYVLGMSVLAFSNKAQLFAMCITLN